MITTKDVAVEDGPDKGKVFVIEKMSLSKGDRWANRVALALLRSGVEISGLTKTGDNGQLEFKGLIDMVGILEIVLKALGGVDDRVAQGLLDELMDNVKLRLPGGSTRSLVVDSDISCINTLWKIRIESIKVNLDFLTAGVTR